MPPSTKRWPSLAAERSAVVGVDVGTTSVKAVVVAESGEVVAEAVSEPVLTRTPEPGAAEQDADEIWQAFVQAVRRVVAEANCPIEAVALAAQSGSLVPILADGRAGPVMLWMDTRSTSLVSGWDDSVKQRIRDVSGWTASPGLGLSSLAWLRAAGHTATRFASVDDFVIHRLTGSWTTNPSNAAGMQMMDVAKLDWSDELCALGGVKRSQLSQIQAAGQAVGPPLADAQAELGLGHETVVVAGGHDQAFAAYGLGVQDPGSVLVSGGTAWVVTAPTDRAAVSALPPNVNLSPHVRPGRWTVSQSLGALGAAIAWWRETAYDDLGLFESDLGTTTADDDVPLFIPSLHDQRRGGWGDFQPGETATALRSRAIIEAAAFEVRRALDTMASVSVEPDRLTLVGGAANSDAVAQVLADVLGLAVHAECGGSWPARGAATLAAEAVGWPTEADARGPKHVARPQTGVESSLGRRYQAYCQATSNSAEGSQ